MYCWEEDVSLVNAMEGQKCVIRTPGSVRLIFTGRNEVVAKVMFLLVSVILLKPQEDGYCCGRYASY